MSEIEATFKKATQAMDAYTGPALSNDQKLKAYGLFKQADKGPCTTDRPGLFDPVGRAKYDAWAGLGDMSKEKAMELYVQHVKETLGVEL